MLISVFSWFIAGLLVVFVVLVTVLGYVGRNEHSCDPTCFDVRFAIGFIVFGLFGATVSASIGQLSKPRPPYVKRMIVAGGAIYLVASMASIYAGGTSLSLIFIPTGLIMAVMIAWELIDRGEIRGTVAGRVVAGFLVLYVVSSTAIAFDRSCDPTCLRMSFFVPFVLLGFFGAALSLSIGQIFRQRPAYVRRVIRISIAVYLFTSIAAVFFGVGVFAVAFIATAIVMAGASRKHPQPTLSLDAPGLARANL
ncbi:MAG: hypothetical protein IH867_11480 [Chloroflexi bacterium]|nr:hypothetical protein [Chloroflexota bacterium]